MGKSTPNKQLLPSLATPSKTEYAEMDIALQREREWYKDSPRYLVKKDIKRAISNHELVQLSESEDLKPIARFNTSIEGFTPYLTPNALRVAKAFGCLWRVIMEEQYGIADPALKLAVTSMVRTQKYQDKLVGSGRFASADSIHCTGNAFDIDVSGYYSLVDNDTAISHVDPRRKAAGQRIGSFIAQSLGETFNAESHDGSYDKRVTESALWTAEVLFKEYEINRVHEFKDSPNACLHIAVNPDF
jgi:hypothetical protein